MPLSRAEADALMAELRATSGRRSMPASRWVGGRKISGEIPISPEIFSTCPASAIHRSAVVSSIPSSRRKRDDGIRVIADEHDDLPVADAADLDGPHGDPIVRSLLKSWRGKDYKGSRYSQTEPAFLGMLGHLLDWKAERNAAEGNDKYAGYDRRDAARARGWRRRLEAPVSDKSIDDVFPPPDDEVF